MPEPTPLAQCQAVSSKGVGRGEHGVMIRRHELSDTEGELLEPLFLQAMFEQPRLDDRTVLNGIVWWTFRTGVA
ncbi:hypothetical protein BX281_3179 [Streptomyces sp. Ag82_O1-15]|nr:hypothetical protein BX281_3179 [Streptomyces sp. Ag82_O1-15]